MPDPNVNVNDQSDEGDGAGTEPLVYDSWLGEQPDDIKEMLSGWEGGLKTALKAERTRAKDFEKQMRDAAKKLEEGSEARTQLEAMADDLVAAKQESAFFEAAHAAGANNIKLLFIAARQDDVIRKDGTSDFVHLKNVYPQLFGSTTAVPRGDAGNLTDPPIAKKSMNTAIRTMAGRQP